ncbi:unnamed protein product, partial [Candidula unifasciata]
ANASVGSRDESCDTCTESDSVLGGPRRGPRINGHSHLRHDRHRHPAGMYDASTVLSSDLESTSFMDSEEDTAS